MVLKKEVMKTQNRELDKGPEYRQLLVQVGCAVCRCSACQISSCRCCRCKQSCMTWLLPARHTCAVILAQPRVRLIFKYM